MTNTIKQIWVTFRKAGIHMFPGATDPAYAGSEYLQYPHRHLFWFKVTIDVFHDDREIEFHVFLRWLESLYDGQLNLDSKSCEMISDELAAKIKDKYPNRNFVIEVAEDGECGSISYYFV